MLKKESKIRVLENFYAVDYVFFGKPVAKVDSCCPLVKEEYLSIKGALMSVFIEMLKMINHQPKPLKEFVDSASLVGISKNTARIAREAARKIIATPKSRQNIKESVSQVMAEDKKANVSKVIEQKITEKAFSIAVDALLIGRTLREAKDYKKLNEWEGRILEDSYKILRDSLVETAYQILDGKTDEPVVKEEKLEEVWVKAIREDAAHLASLDGVANIDEALTDREKTFLFGRIQRVFGDCAEKCGRIAITSKQRACKDVCIAKKDQSIKAARAQARADKAKAKGDHEKAAKHSQTAKDIRSY
jgi:hypothetical protein